MSRCSAAMIWSTDRMVVGNAAPSDCSGAARAVAECAFSLARTQHRRVAIPSIRCAPLVLWTLSSGGGKARVEQRPALARRPQDRLPRRPPVVAAAPPHDGAVMAVWCGGRILVVQQSYRSNPSWPGGGIRRGEEPRAALGSLGRGALMPPRFWARRLSILPRKMAAFDEDRTADPPRLRHRPAERPTHPRANVDPSAFEGVGRCAG